MFEAGLDHLTYSGKVSECSWDSDEQLWVCLCMRVDKNTPNEFSTFQEVMESINDNITADVLLSEIDEIIHLPMYAYRMKTKTSSAWHL
ncbi:hypothetical protein CDL15_Pgr023617 [Punica granatum]|uniref:mRNA capping enzyme C-terminal domain-containing protein n=1 Tax=Punica granatum TaxID=22663 RepID=A0A218W998_PUNGR|nr:hypothetical protein CDL15_Pgr023617 [Punica granatum]